MSCLLFYHRNAANLKATVNKQITGCPDFFRL